VRVCVPLAILAPLWQENGSFPTLLQSCRFPGFMLQWFDGLIASDCKVDMGKGFGQVCSVGDWMWVPTQEVQYLRNPCMLSNRTKPEGCSHA